MSVPRVHRFSPFRNRTSSSLSLKSDLMEMNEILEKLPKHLLSLVIDQPYDEYTAQNHAVWRYVMRQNVRYLSKVAHDSYLDGLKKTGISIDRIPSMYGMNRILKDIGWAAVSVDGFIPPSAFMEFQACNVLVIAADIRPIDQLGYTPAPDIIHEAAGHAPIIADPAYAHYLREFGYIGSKAFSTPHDRKLYEAIRHLSILKADPYTPQEAVREAEAALEKLAGMETETSELCLIRNLHWWSVEYGLIGEISDPKIYGAGLLSSISESFYCLQPSVKKLPYTLEACRVNFDITEPQPQLFVTPDFETLLNVLEEFAGTMALRKGGLDGVKKAVMSEDTATCVYSSGLQVSGTFTDVIEYEGRSAYIRTTGPTSLSYNDLELEGHSKNYHKDGFGSPVGKIRNLARPLEDFSGEELAQIGLFEGEQVFLEFESGVRVAGVLRSVTLKANHVVILTFSECNVVLNGQTLFDPSWGLYDMAVGSRIVSAYPGPADPEAFGLNYPVPEEKTHKINHSEENKKLHSLYQQVRDIREQNCSYAILPTVWEELHRLDPADWLCALEIYELLRNKGIADGFADEVLSFLERRKTEGTIKKKLIDDGIAALNDF
jgi:phenylalanine-4-hydroxylase